MNLSLTNVLAVLFLAAQSQTVIADAKEQTRDISKYFEPTFEPAPEPDFVPPADVVTDAILASVREQMSTAGSVEGRLAVLDRLSPFEWNTLTVAFFRVGHFKVGDLPDGIFAAYGKVLDLPADETFPLRIRMNKGMTPAFKRFSNAGLTVASPTQIELKNCE